MGRQIWKFVLFSMDCKAISSVIMAPIHTFQPVDLGFSLKDFNLRGPCPACTSVQ